MKDPYEILGINQGATRDEIRSAYRTYVIKNHPDKHPECKDKRYYNEKMKEGTDAYTTLTNNKGSTEGARTEPPREEQRGGDEGEERRQREWENQEEARGREEERIRAEEEVRIKAQARRKFVKKVKVASAGSFAAASILFGSLYLAHYNHTLNGKIKNSTIFEYEQKQMNESFFSLVADLKKPAEHPPEELSWENANIEYVCPNKKKLEKILQVNALNEALIKIGQKRKYDVSGLNKLDKKIDNLAINNLDGLLNGYIETCSYRRAYGHTDNLISKCAEKIYRTKTREIHSNVETAYFSIEDKDYDGWWHIFKNAGLLVEKTGNKIIRWPILGACRVVLWDAADSTLKRKISDKDKLEAYENLLKDAYNDLFSKFEGVKIEDYELYKRIAGKIDAKAKEENIETAFNKKAEVYLTKLSEAPEVVKVTNYFKKINYNLDSAPSDDYFKNFSSQEIAKNIKTPEQAQFYLNNHMHYGFFADKDEFSQVRCSDPFKLIYPRSFKDIHEKGKGVCIDYAIAAAALLGDDGYLPQVLFLYNKGEDAGHMVFLYECRQNNRVKYATAGLSCDPRIKNSTIEGLVKDLGYENYKIRAVKGEYLN